MAKPPEIYGVHSVILCNEGVASKRATVCFNQNDGRLYIHLDGAHDEYVTVMPHEQRDAPIRVIPRAVSEPSH